MWSNSPSRMVCKSSRVSRVILFGVPFFLGIVPPYLLLLRPTRSSQVLVSHPPLEGGSGSDEGKASTLTHHRQCFLRTGDRMAWPWPWLPSFNPHLRRSEPRRFTGRTISLATSLVGSAPSCAPCSVQLSPWTPAMQGYHSYWLNRVSRTVTNPKTVTHKPARKRRHIWRPFTSAYMPAHFVCHGPKKNEE